MCRCVSVYVCIHVHLWGVCVCVCVCVCVHVYPGVCAWARVCACVCACVHVDTWQWCVPSLKVLLYTPPPPLTHSSTVTMETNQSYSSIHRLSPLLPHCSFSSSLLSFNDSILRNLGSALLCAAIIRRSIQHLSPRSPALVGVLLLGEGLIMVPRRRNARGGWRTHYVLAPLKNCNLASVSSIKHDTESRQVHDCGCIALRRHGTIISPLFSRSLPPGCGESVLVPPCPYPGLASGSVAVYVGPWCPLRLKLRRRTIFNQMNSTSADSFL